MGIRPPDPKFHRRSIRLKGFDYSSAGEYFVTICTHGRQHLFGEIIQNEMQLNEFGLIAQSVWQNLPLRYHHLELDEFVVMPNHIHGILIINENAAAGVKEENGWVGAIHELPLPGEPDNLLSRSGRRKMTIPLVIGYYKMNTAKKINQSRQTLGQSVWQRNYYEHIICNGCEYEAIANYIADNPLNWCGDPENVVLR